MYVEHKVWLFCKSTSTIELHRTWPARLTGLLSALHAVLISIGDVNYNTEINKHVPPSMIRIVADDLATSSRDPSMAVQDTSVPFRSFIGSGAVSIDVSVIDP